MCEGMTEQEFEMLFKDGGKSPTYHSNMMATMRRVVCKNAHRIKPPEEVVRTSEARSTSHDTLIKVTDTAEYLCEKRHTLPFFKITDE
jgi:hypothetical protein